MNRKLGIMDIFVKKTKKKDKYWTPRNYIYFKKYFKLQFRIKFLLVDNSHLA